MSTDEDQREGGGWRELLVVGLAAALTVVAVDQLLYQWFPPDARLLQAHEGITRLETGNPRTVVLGSSHARSFRAVRDVLAERTDGAHDMVIIPEEGGLFRAYDWIAQHRLRPLLEARDADGRHRLDRLEHFLLITTVYDTCPVKGVPSGLPAQAWGVGDFLDDVMRSGVTDFNRNYLRARWNELWSRSALVQDRGVARIIGKVRWAVSPEERALKQQQQYRANLESYADTCFDPDQIAAFERTLELVTARGLDVTVVLFALDPIIVSEKARATTLTRYAELVADLQRKYRFRVVDLTETTPLVHEDFMDDLDHVTPAGNRKLAPWLLDGPLSYLLAPSTRERPEVRVQR